MICSLYVFCLFQQCLQLDADDRPTCSQLLRHEFFAKNGFAATFEKELKARLQKEAHDNPLLRSQKSQSSGNKDDDKDNRKKKDKKEKEKKVIPKVVPHVCTHVQCDVS